ncbi:MAG: hypothetical protein AB7P03_09985 [Kofleriaceae bacterium]
MRSTRGWVVLVAIGCNGAKVPAAGSGTAASPGDLGSAIAPPPSAGPGSSADSPTDAPLAPAVCELTGNYRVRYRRRNEDEVEWMRFSVSGDPLKLKITNDVGIFGFNPGTIALAADPAACKLTLTPVDKTNDSRVVLVLDPTTSKVTGHLKWYDGSDLINVYGVRGETTLAAADACIAPGVYALELGPKAEWETPECGTPNERVGTLYLRVEWLAGEVTVDDVYSPTTTYSTPFAPRASSVETVKRAGPCQLDLKLRQNNGVELSARLEFGNLVVKGAASQVQYRAVEGPDESEHYYECDGTNFPITGKRIATPPWST